MKPTSRHLIAPLVVAAIALASGQAFADPPTRVARLNYLKGSVSFRAASLDDWAPATLNYPLTTGDQLWTDPNSWAEMHIGSTAIRIAPSTAFAFLNLDDGTMQIRLSEGALDLRVRNLDGDALEVDTPSAAVSVTRPGVYRFDALPDGGSTRVTVRYGMAAVSADGPEFWVRDGETAAIYGSDGASHEIFRAGAEDDWERWCRSRDEREDRAASLRYVSYEMTGYEDLDDYGTWNSIPEYGWAWQPRVAVGWSPYRHGQWRWVGSWGWTWVDEAPWGFAPFHYGRWACMRGSWYWVPGMYSVHPVYAPALVAFIGGDHWGLSIGFGRSHVGWFPLAPGEFWMPHYRASHGYIRDLNAMHVNVTNISIKDYNPARGTYVNRAVAGAVTAVPRDVFLGGRAVGRDAVAVDSRAMMRAEVVGSSVPLSPRAESVTGRRGGAVARPSATSLNRPVFARSQPAASAVPFSTQERAIQANGGRPLDESSMARLRGETGDRGNGTAVRMAGSRGGYRDSPARAEGGGNRPDTSAGASAGSYGSGTATRRSDGWATSQGGRTTEGTQPSGSVGAARPEVNDRPTWARPRSGETQQTDPGAGGANRTGASGRSGGTVGSATGRTGGSQVDRPADTGQSEARPRFGSRGSTGGGSSQSDSNDRPAAGRSSGGDTSRSGGAIGGARPRGGEAQPAPSSKAPATTAKPRSGGRGGDSASFDSNSRSYSNDPSSSAGSRGGARSRGRG